jgi:hypothetical protein
MKLAAAVMVLVACGGKESPPPAQPVSNTVPVPDAGPIDAPMDEASAAIAKMTEFRDDMCKCADTACADRVQEEMTKWATTMAEDASRAREKRPAVSEEVMKRMTEIGQTYGECMTKAMTAGAGSAVTP